ncbi:MAG: hypothetical protein E6K91_07925 [Thaumarchaeota archaeon]|nr:MAG: hypothetical protein E6K91_07925 [Nitrososphaerota archaeon]
MVVEIGKIAQTLLDTPVGYVEETLSSIIRKPVYLNVVEQNSLHDTRYVRKVIIGHGQFPILRAIVKFDSENLPREVMTGLLQKKESIGNILRKNNITTERHVVALNFDSTRKTVTRDYHILCRDSLWFEVSEEIRLDFLSACQNS